MTINEIFKIFHTYWQEKTLREKWILRYGFFFLCIFIAFYFVWLPIHNNKLLQDSIDSQQKLITWMKEHAPLVKKSRMQSQENKNTKEVFANIEGAFKNTSIVRLSSSKVSVTFKDIPFDDLINKLLQVQKNFNINVNEIQINMTDTSGRVEGKVTLTLGS